MAEAVAEFRRREGFERGEGVTRLKALLGGGGGLGVPGADVLANVAAEEVGAEGALKIRRSLLAGLDGPVGDAAVAFEFPTLGAFDDSGGGAGVDAAGAGAAAVWWGRAVIGDREGKKEFAEEKPGSAGFVDEAGVFADPAEAGRAGVAALEQGGGIDGDTVGEL